MFTRTVAPGIELRLFDLADIETVFASVERNRVYLRQWLPWVDMTRSAADIREFITRARIQYENNRGPQTGIWIDGEFGGSLGCHPVDHANRRCSVGYWIDPRHSGKGIITRCCTSMLDYLFVDICLHRVVIECGVGNHKSCRVPERLGFTREGVAREAEWVNDRWVDLQVWSMLSHEWAKRTASGR